MQNTLLTLKSLNIHFFHAASDEDDDTEPIRPYAQDRCLVGRVPRPAGSRPGRGGGVAIIVRKNVPVSLDLLLTTRFFKYWINYKNFSQPQRKKVIRFYQLTKKTEVVVFYHV